MLFCVLLASWCVAGTREHRRRQALELSSCFARGVYVSPVSRERSQCDWKLITNNFISFVVSGVMHGSQFP